jgi:hypothetical protein
VQSLRFAFVHWRVSQRYGQSLTDGTLTLPPFGAFFGRV